MASEDPAAPPPPPPAPTTLPATPPCPPTPPCSGWCSARSWRRRSPGRGPFTAFAPSDDAFARLAPGTLDTLLKPENAATLASILKYHILSGMVTLDPLKAQITTGGRRAALTTVNGQPLTATLENGLVLPTDANGGKSYISQPTSRKRTALST